MDLDRLNSVMAARRIVPTNPVPATHESQPRRDRELIETNDFCENPRHARDPNFQLSIFNSQGRAVGRRLLRVEKPRI